MTLAVAFALPLPVLADSDIHHILFETPLHDETSACDVISQSVALSGSDNIEKAFKYFVGQGLTPNQSAGIVGNMIAESGVIPGIHQTSRKIDKVPVPDNGYGISQWTPANRQQGLISYAKTHGEIDSLEVELGYVWAELTGKAGGGGNYSSILTQLKATSSLSDATNVWLLKYEAPKVPNLQERAKNAGDVIRLYGKSVTQNAAADPSTTAPDAAASLSSSCSDIVSAGQDTKFVDGFRVYNQYDAAWANKPYGSSTISASGCGPSAMAMIITALTGQTVTPVETANYAASKGQYVAGSGSSWSISPVLAERWGLKSKAIGADVAKISATLQAGGLVITSGQGPKPFSSGGHFIVIRAVTANNKWKVGDSGHNDTSDKEWDPQQLISSMNGGSVYAITK